jgi:proliferating cell nuclear antigen
MYVKTIQANSLKVMFEVLKDIITDVNFVFTPEGISVCTLDTAHVTFISMHLKHDNFEKYECKTRTLAGLNMLNTFKILKSISGSDTLTMSIDHSGETIDMEIENDVKKTMTKFKLKLLDINDDVYDQPNITMDCTTIVSSALFQRIIRDMTNLADNVQITRHTNKLSFKCDGDFVQQETGIDCTETIDYTITETFSLKYINMFIKASSICSNIEINQSTSGPISFKYFIANLGYITFFLAPVTTDD